MDKDKIKQIREELKLTQVEFAALVGVSPSTVSNWELNVCSPGKMARILLAEKIRGYKLDRHKWHTSYCLEKLNKEKK